MKIRVSKKSCNISSLMELICAILIFILFLQFTIESGGMLLYYLKIALAMLMWWHILFFSKIIKKEFVILIAFGCYVLLFSFLRYGSYQVLLIYLPISYYLLKKDKLNKWIWSILPLAIFFITLSSWVQSPNQYILFPNMSRNYVSVFSIFSLGLFNLLLEKEKKELPIVLMVLNFIVCISAIGRGGILASAIMLILFISKWMFARNAINGKKRTYRIFFITIALITLTFIVYANLEYIAITYFGRFFGVEESAEISSLIRKEMINNYLNYCKESLSSLILGANASSFSSIDANLHNSYIQLHSQFGLFGLIFLVIGAIKSIIQLYREKKWCSAIIFIGILLRAATDWSFPAFPCDILVLYYIFRPYVTTKLSIGRAI